MSFSGGLFFTNRGRALQAKAQTGVQLNFTRIGVGDGQLEGQAIDELTALISEKKSLTLNKYKTLPSGKAVVGGILSNQGLVTGFYWRELGLFATDPDLGEILYCYGNAGVLAEYIPAGGGAEILEKQVDVVSLIGNASNVSATIDQSLLFASQEDLLDHASLTATAHGAVSAATASTIMARDAAGRAKVFAPSAEDDIARKLEVDAVQTNLTTHTADTTTAHGINTKATTTTYTTTLNTTWTGTSAPFSKAQTVTGILSTDNPIIDVTMSGTFATDEARAKAWGFIYRAVTSANTVTFYATEKPTVELPLQIKVVR